MTQNMRMPVARSAGQSLSTTLTLNLVEQPKSPCSTPENVGVADSSQNENRGVAAPVAGSMLGCFGHAPSHMA